MSSTLSELGVSFSEGGTLGCLVCLGRLQGDGPDGTPATLTSTATYCYPGLPYPGLPSYSRSISRPEGIANSTPAAC